MSQPKFTNSELVDMILVLGETKQCYSGARRRYAELYPDRYLPSAYMFTALVQRARETGSLQVCDARTVRRRNKKVCDPRIIRSQNRKGAILEAIENNPSSSIRQIARDLNLSSSIVWRRLKESQVLRLTSFQCQINHTLEPDVYPTRTKFCQWLIDKYTEKVDFPLEILFTDEACLTQEGIFSIHNQHQWVPESNEGRFSVNVWAGILDNSIIGPFILPDSITNENYKNFLENDLKLLLKQVRFEVRQEMWFQHNGSTPYFTSNIREYLNNVFKDRWIARGGPVAWPLCSPDLNPVEFFLWSRMKQIVYKTKINNIDELKNQIQNAAKAIMEQNILESVMESLMQRACICIQAGGSSFQHLL